MEDFFEMGLELAGATEATARSLMPYSGKNNKLLADQIAVETLRNKLNAIDYKLRIIIGEGEKDNAPMLYGGEILGRKHKSEQIDFDIIVDPLECTTNFARGLQDSMCVLGAFPVDSITEIPGTYMEQLLLPPEMNKLLPNTINFETPVEKVIALTSRAIQRPANTITVAVQDRPRHHELIKQIRATGAGVALIDSGSISTALKIMTGNSQRINLLWGIFGAPEGLIIASMARLSGFGFIGRLSPHDQKSSTETRQLGLEKKTLRSEEWVSNNGVLVMSGIHTSPLLPGVEYLTNSSSLRTHTLVWSPTRFAMITHRDGTQENIEYRKIASA